jgi:hypothetical protein
MRVAPATLYTKRIGNLPLLVRSGKAKINAPPNARPRFFQKKALLWLAILAPRIHLSFYMRGICCCFNALSARAFLKAS